MEHSRNQNAEEYYDDRPVSLIRAVKNASQTCVQTVDRVHLQPEKEVILIIAPDNFHDDTTECNLRHYSAVPDAIKQAEVLSQFVDSFSAMSIVVFLLQFFENIRSDYDNGEIAESSHYSRDQRLEVKPIKNVFGI